MTPKSQNFGAREALQKHLFLNSGLLKHIYGAMNMHIKAELLEVVSSN
jgi:hypothetical protein